MTYKRFLKLEKQRKMVFVLIKLEDPAITLPGLALFSKPQSEVRG